jgi:hypothetical protein
MRDCQFSPYYFILFFIIQAWAQFAANNKTNIATTVTRPPTLTTHLPPFPTITDHPNIINIISIITAIITTIITMTIITNIITRDLIMDNITIKGLIIISIMTKIKALIIIRTGAIRALTTVTVTGVIRDLTITQIIKALIQEATKAGTIRHLIVGRTKAMTVEETQEMITIVEVMTTEQATTQEEPQVGIDIFW